MVRYLSVSVSDFLHVIIPGRDQLRSSSESQALVAFAHQPALLSPDNMIWCSCVMSMNHGAVGGLFFSRLSCLAKWWHAGMFVFL